MAAVITDTGVVLPARESIWVRVQRTLSNWGQKIKGAAVKVGNFIARAARWLWNSTPVQWVVTNTQIVAGKIWGVLSGPVGWVAAPIAAIIFAPKAMAIMLLVIVAGMGLTLYGLYRLGKAKRPEESNEQFADRITNKIADVIGIDRPMGDETPPLDPEETLDTRKAYLDGLYRSAEAGQDMDAMSSLVGRLHFLEVRGPFDTKLSPSSKPDQIYRDARKKAEALNFGSDWKWNWNRMKNAIFNEDKRLRDTAKLKAEQANLTSV